MDLLPQDVVDLIHTYEEAIITAPHPVYGTVRAYTEPEAYRDIISGVKPPERYIYFSGNNYCSIPAMAGYCFQCGDPSFFERDTVYAPSWKRCCRCDYDDRFFVDYYTDLDELDW